MDFFRKIFQVGSQSSFNFPYISRVIKDNGIVFNPSKKLVVDCYADADFAGLWGHKYLQDPICARCSIQGILQLLEVAP